MTRPIIHTRLTMADEGAGPVLTLVRPDGGLIHAPRLAARLGLAAPPALEALLQGDDRGQDAQVLRLWHAAAAGEGGPAMQLVPSARRVQWLHRPGKILCVGLNYRRHAEEMGSPLPQWPVLFSKFANALAPCDATVAVPDPALSQRLDYETELVVVVGRRLDAAGASRPLEYVAGYCTGHDLSARDLQKERGGQWLLGKTLDGFAPLGPDFVGAALAGDPEGMAILTRRNGTVVQDSSTGDCIFSVAEILAYVARHFPLEPGDLVFTGTPEGVIAGRPAGEQQWLQPGEVLESSVGALGTLRITLVSPRLQA